MTLAGHQIYVTSEQYTNSVNVTSYPTEKGLPITDNVQRQPKTWSLTANIMSPEGENTDTGARKVYKALETKQNNGTLVSYTGRTKASNVVIVQMDQTNDDTIMNGIPVTISLQEIRIAKDPTVKKKTTKKSSGKKSKTSVKKSTKKTHKIVKGDTFWDLAKRYGTTVKKLESLNPSMKARYLHIGAEMIIAA